MALNFPASSASPWTAPNGVIYTWNTDGYWEAKADPNDFDADYLKLDATNDPVTGDLALEQDLAVTGTSDFTGLTTHEAGVSVTGGECRVAGRLLAEQVRGNISVDKNTSNKIDLHRAELVTQSQASSITGYFTNLSIARAPAGKVFAFYSEGNAPSYFNGGIQFDTADGANALDDYEIGAWTPVLEQSDGAGTFTYAVQEGGYTKVGRLVTCQGRVTISSVSGTSTAPLRIGGFPFTSLNNSNRRNCGNVAIWSGFSATRFPNAGLLMISNSIVADLQCGTGGSTTANVRGSDITTSNMRIDFSITYTAA